MRERPEPHADHQYPMEASPPRLVKHDLYEAAGQRQFMHDSPSRKRGGPQIIAAAHATKEPTYRANRDPIGVFQ